MEVVPAAEYDRHHGSLVHWNCQNADRSPLVPEIAFQEWVGQGLLDPAALPNYLEEYRHGLSKRARERKRERDR